MNYIIETAELIGTFAFALSGAIIGVEKKLDYYGITILAIITALGGGIIRDILLGNTPPNAFFMPIFIIISILSSILVILFHNQHQAKNWML